MLPGTAAGSSSAALGAAPACAGGLRAPLRRTVRVGTTCTRGTSLRHTDLYEAHVDRIGDGI